MTRIFSQSGHNGIGERLDHNASRRARACWSRR